MSCYTYGHSWDVQSEAIKEEDGELYRVQVLKCSYKACPMPHRTVVSRLVAGQWELVSGNYGF